MSNEEIKKQFLAMQEAFRNMIEALKKINAQIENEQKAFDVIENKNARFVLCKNQAPKTQYDANILRTHEPEHKN